MLEIRSDQEAYLKEHIPTSVHISYGEFRGPKENPGQLPELNKLAAALGSKGIGVSGAISERGAVRGVFRSCTGHRASGAYRRETFPSL